MRGRGFALPDRDRDSVVASLDRQAVIATGYFYIAVVIDDRLLIVLDLTDPGGPSTPLYTADFYRACAARLAPGGAMTLHIASPVAHPARIREGIASLRAAFGKVTPYLTSIPLYGG